MARLYSNALRNSNGDRVVHLMCIEGRKMLTGWQNVSIGEGRYITAYFDPDTGSIPVGWNKIDGSWYYYSYHDPYIYTGPITVFGEQYTMTPDGMLLGYYGDETPDAVPI